MTIYPLSLQYLFCLQIIGTEGDPSIIVSRSHTGPIEDIVHKALGQDTRIIKAGGAGEFNLVLTLVKKILWKGKIPLN